MSDTKQLYTKYAKTLLEDRVLPEYPRPQLVRDSFENLNGFWDYHVDKQPLIPEHYDGKILVPFPIESLLSKVNKRLEADDFLIYRRFFELPKKFQKDLVFLNFQAVDQNATVYLNQKKLGTHQGGYFPFSLDITDGLREKNELVVIVSDPTNSSYSAFGKQSLNPGGIFYTPVTGIWQTVWLESVAKNHMKNLKILPDFDQSEVKITLEGTLEPQGIIKIYSKQKLILEKKFKTAENIVALPNFIPWTPENPHLYEVTVELKNDFVKSYFGMRKWALGEGKYGKALFLNNQGIFLSGVLDQGFWSDGLYTPASDEALVDDIQLMKSMGFNTLRKHVKVEPLRWYYHCDRLGMIVWQDFVNGGKVSIPKMMILPNIGFKGIDDEKSLDSFGRGTEESRAAFFEEIKQNVSLLGNSPSVGLWTIFNEGWGQFQSQKAYDFLKALDPSRIIDAASGWFDQGGPDLASIHTYFKKINVEKGARPVALSEFGGYSCKIPDHAYHLTKEYGYRKFKDPKTLEAAVVNLYQGEVIPNIKKGLCAAIYTQLSDVESETNGLITYDRGIVKITPMVMKSLNDEIKKT
ncbi:MAG TPA: glycoside hydrolase family 2 [Acholeplasmatales bacterium]|nr:glycoside hydrolase family 2 [Acholeplasmatales bacterium]